MIVRPELAGTRIGAKIPLRERDFPAADRERAPDRNCPLRFFIRRIVGSHDEIAGRDHHELGAIVAIPEDLAGIGGGSSGRNGGGRRRRSIGRSGTGRDGRARGDGETALLRIGSRARRCRKRCEEQQKQQTQIHVVVSGRSARSFETSTGEPPCFISGRSARRGVGAVAAPAGDWMPRVPDGSNRL